MSRGINKVILVGYLGSDPEVRYTPTGTAVANFSIAISESWKDKQTGEKKERTEWVKAVAYNRLAEVAGDYLRKGSQVYLEGRLQTRKWMDKTNVERVTTEVILNDLQLLGKKDAHSLSHEQESAPDYSPSARSQETISSTPVHKPGFSGKDQDFDDDIPF